MYSRSHGRRYGAALFLGVMLFVAASQGWAQAPAAADGVVFQRGLDRMWVAFCAALVFTMQLGFLALEVGFVRPPSVFAVAMKNFIDVVAVNMGFFLMGFGLMFGGSNGLFGTDFSGLSELGRYESSPGMGPIFYLFQLGFATTAATIVSGAMAGRTNFFPYILISLANGALIYPVFGHWAWGHMYVTDNAPWLQRLGFLDFAGSTVVHSVGAWVALAGALVVGPRQGRYGADGQLVALDRTQYSAAWSAFGVLILWVGWWGFNGGSTLAFNDRIGGIIINTCIAGAAGAISSFTHTWFLQDHDDLYDKLLGGTLGGMVAITACSNLVDPFDALIVGWVAGLIHDWVYDLVLKRWRIDDAVGAVPVHGGCGIWGTLCVALLGDSEAFPNGHGVMQQLGVQVLGIAVCFVWTFGTAYPLMRLLRRFVGLRMSEEEERTGVVKLTPST